MAVMVTVPLSVDLGEPFVESAGRKGIFRLFAEAERVATLPHLSTKGRPLRRLQ
uniref:Uncharacterized protein n=1 Tax=Amphimedon queenslandica TaxID=400682 RepID=A0A1X7TVP1_AMPQE